VSDEVQIVLMYNSITHSSEFYLQHFRTTENETGFSTDAKFKLHALHKMLLSTSALRSLPLCYLCMAWGKLHNSVVVTCNQPIVQHYLWITHLHSNRSIMLRCKWMFTRSWALKLIAIQHCSVAKPRSAKTVAVLADNGLLSPLRCSAMSVKKETSNNTCLFSLLLNTTQWGSLFATKALQVHSIQYTLQNKQYTVKNKNTRNKV